MSRGFLNVRVDGSKRELRPRLLFTRQPKVEKEINSELSRDLDQGEFIEFDSVEDFLNALYEIAASQ